MQLIYCANQLINQGLLEFQNSPWNSGCTFCFTKWILFQQYYILNNNLSMAAHIRRRIVNTLTLTKSSLGVVCLVNLVHQGPIWRGLMWPGPSLQSAQGVITCSINACPVQKRAWPHKTTSDVCHQSDQLPTMVANNT